MLLNTNILFSPFFNRFFELFKKYGGYKTGKLKLKKPKQLQVSKCPLDYFSFF